MRSDGGVARAAFSPGGVADSRPRPRLRPRRGGAGVHAGEAGRWAVSAGAAGPRIAAALWAMHEHLMGQAECTVKVINLFIHF